MNDQDRDLIIALARGDLSTTAAGDAMARIETDPELASEYADQVVALQFLQSAAPPMMTPSERVTLHTNLTDQLGLIPATAPVAVTTKKKAQWWVPVFGLATAAAVVAAFVIFPSTPQDTFQEVSADLGSEIESTSQPFTASPQTTVAAAGASDAAGSEPSAAAEEAPEANDTPLSVYETDSLALEELLERTNGANSPESVQRQLSSLSSKAIVDLDSDQVTACLADLGPDLPDGVLDVHVIGADMTEDQTVIHVGFDFGEGIDGGMSFVLETCEVVARSPQG